MSSILDLITGGGLLPYVYCKRVTLERSQSDPSLTNISLNLEILQNANALSNSSWLNSLSTQGVNFLDSMFIQVLKFKNPENVKKLLPANDPLASPVPGNVYVAKQILGDAYLPRGLNVLKTTEYDEEVVRINVPDNMLFSPEEGSFDAPFQVSNSSIIGNLSAKDALPALAQQGKVEHRIVEGQPYYVIPFNYRSDNFDPKQDPNLGFAFYSFLNLPYWIQNLEIAGSTIDAGLYQDMFEKLIVEGPVNTEVVFENGKARKTRQAFFLPSGLSWDGSVHLHATGVNPDPSGYSGDGGLSGEMEISESGQILSFGSDLTGWMVGEKHLNANQAKLRLLEVPNNKIVDFRSGLFPEPLDEALGLGTATKVFNLNTDVTNTLENFVSPFQKEKKKDFIRDSDTEYSKLYICRDSSNNARGIFFINVFELLKNNSNLFPLLFDKTSGDMPDLFLNEIEKALILQKCKLLQLKIYRDRIKKNLIGVRYENYSNDEAYEEPSQLIGTISDLSGYMTSQAHGSNIDEITGVSTAFSDDISAFSTRYFMFSDSRMRSVSAGVYRYRIELDFKDGTYEFLLELLNDLNETKALLDEYYDLSTSYYPTVGAFEGFSSTKLAKDQLKSSLRKYFKNGSFSPKFLEKVTELTTDTNTSQATWAFKPWKRAPIVLEQVQRIFGIFPDVDGTSNGVDFSSSALKNMISPSAESGGSPHGIEFFSRLLGSSIRKIKSLLGASKANSTGNELASSSTTNGYNQNSLTSYTITPSDFTIREDYTFDHPEELFHAISNNNIYMDYLSIGNPLSTGFTGLRSLRPDYFKNRCRLEAAKLSPLAKNESPGFYRTGNGVLDGNIGLPIQPAGSSGPVVVIGDDSFSRTAFSYLAPSIVKLEDPYHDTDIYNFTYSAFKPTAVSYLDNPQIGTSVMHHPSFFDFENYNNLYLGLYNYYLNKQENPDADLTDAFTSAPGDDVFEAVMRAREPFKRTFEEFGITLHDVNLHDKFFDKEPGAVSVEKDTSKRTSFLPPYEYSDGLINPISFFRSFGYSKYQNVIGLKYNSPSPAGYDINLPISMKLNTIDQQFRSIYNVSIFYNQIERAFKPDSPSRLQFNNFLYFNVGLTAKIEVFRGIKQLGIQKDDEDSWSLLKEEDLALTDNQKLFCRIVLYDQSLTRDISPPMVDKYFLIYNNASDLAPPMMNLPDIANTQADVTDFWESQGAAKLVQNKVATSEVLVDGSATSAMQIDANVFPSISVSGGPFQTPGAAGTPAIGATGGTAAAPGLSTGASTGGGSASPSTSTPVAVGSGTGIGGAGGGGGGGY